MFPCPALVRLNQAFRIVSLAGVFKAVLRGPGASAAAMAVRQLRIVELVASTRVTSACKAVLVRVLGTVALSASLIASIAVLMTPKPASVVAALMRAHNW